MNQPPTTTADLMRYAVAAPATAVAVPPPPPAAAAAARSPPHRPIAAPAAAVPPPPPPAEPDAAALQRRVRELEAALASSEAERERLAQRVAALEAEKKHPKPRGRMPLGATGWDHATGAWQYPPGVLPQSPRKRARRASVKARRKWEGESSDEEPPPAVAAGAVFIDDGQCWLVYKRESKELPINAEGDVRTFDVVYYYAAKDPKPTEETYLAACEHSGADEVAAWIATTHEKADACARAHRRKRDDERSAPRERGAGRAPASQITAAAEARPGAARGAAPRPRRARRHRGRAVRRARHRRRGRPRRLPHRVEGRDALRGAPGRRDGDARARGCRVRKSPPV